VVGAQECFHLSLVSVTSVFVPSLLLLEAEGRELLILLSSVKCLVYFGLSFLFLWLDSRVVGVRREVDSTLFFVVVGESIRALES